jgi:hypothetical protein
MYLYVPMDGRSIAVDEYIISSTGLQLDTLVACLEEQLGKTLEREDLEEVELINYEPLVEETEVFTMPQTEKIGKI